MRRAKRVAPKKTQQEKQRERNERDKLKRAEARAIRKETKAEAVARLKAEAETERIAKRVKLLAARMEAARLATEQEQEKVFINRLIDLSALKCVRLNSQTLVYTKQHIPEEVTLYKFINRKPKFLDQWEALKLKR